MNRTHEARGSNPLGSTIYTVSLEERWRAEIPGDAGRAFLADPITGSVFISDGWACRSQPFACTVSTS